ncbi:MAG: SDR family oxidoreductase [Nitrospira sp.]|nr:SDR family oxidoreductase [Nitrospira sp.]
MTGTVLITGANRGLGLEFVHQYAAAGWRVLACCRDPGRATQLSALATKSDGVSVYPLDVTDAKQIRTLAETVEDTPVDLLINNAGIYGQRDADFGNTDTSRWLETLRVNVIAPMKVMEALVAAVVVSRRRTIACISSRMGSIGDNTSGGSYVYRSSKAALNAVAKSAANDLKERGITVVVLHPGWVRTDMGGPSASLTVEDSVTHLRRILDRVSLRDTGSFFDIDGSIIPW